MTHENTDYVEALHSKGYRVTPQRLIVLDAVCVLQKHATLAEIQAATNDMDPTIDLSTIYRALHVLTEAELIIESEIKGVGKVYSLAGESDHHHMICNACGKIFTISNSVIEPVFQRIRETYNFEVQADHLVFNGQCKVCRSIASK